MPFKLNISDKGKAWKIDLESEVFVGKSLGDHIFGKEIKSDLDGYEFEITGGNDTAGFPLSKDVPGLGLKKVMLTRGFGMRTAKPEGLRRKKSVRGKTISANISLINLKVTKHGHKALHEIFPEQNQPKEKKTVPVSPAPAA